MKQLGRLRETTSRGQWMSIGVAAATLLTPLVKRWNDLRTAERALALRDEAEARLRTWRGYLSALPSQPSKQELQERVQSIRVSRKVSSRIWLAGVGVGLVAAGAGAFWYVRRRLAASLDAPLLELPATSANGHTVERASISTLLTMPVAPPAAEPVEPESQREAVSDGDEEPAAAAETPAAERGDSPPAQFIGNIRTLVYHAADADELPAEENRIYFASEDDARAAGYHRDRDEISAGGNEQP